MINYKRQSWKACPILKTFFCQKVLIQPNCFATQADQNMPVVTTAQLTGNILLSCISLVAQDHRLNSCSLHPENAFKQYFLGIRIYKALILINIKVIKPLPSTDNGAQPCAGSPHQRLLVPKCCLMWPTCPWTKCVLGLRGGGGLTPGAVAAPLQTAHPLDLDSQHRRMLPASC